MSPLHIQNKANFLLFQMPPATPWRSKAARLPFHTKVQKAAIPDDSSAEEEIPISQPKKTPKKARFADDQASPSQGRGRAIPAPDRGAKKRVKYAALPAADELDEPAQDASGESDFNDELDDVESIAETAFSHVLSQATSRA